MERISSRDGTPLALDRVGQGPPLILVVGAFNGRGKGAPLAQRLSGDFTVYTYDRRARGDSGDTPPYAPERELEDLEAVIAHAGGSASVFGYSSGAVLGVLAAARGLAIPRLVLFESPIATGPARENASRLPERMTALLKAGRPGDAVALFQTEGIGLPVELVKELRQAPFWPALEAIAQSAVYDATLTACPIPEELAAAVTTPTLVLSGEQTWPALKVSSQALARAIPDARYLEVPGREHELEPEGLAPVLRRFLLDQA